MNSLRYKEELCSKLRSCQHAVRGISLCKHLVHPFHLSTVCKTIGMPVSQVCICINMLTSSEAAGKAFVSETGRGMNLWWGTKEGGNAVICLLWYADGTSNHFIAIKAWSEAAPLLSQRLCNRGKLHLHVPFFLLLLPRWHRRLTQLSRSVTPSGAFDSSVSGGLSGVLLRVSTPAVMLLLGGCPAF